MKKLSTLMILICLFGLLAGCAFNDKQITILKKEGKEGKEVYRTVAYKNKIDDTTAVNIQEMLHSDKWVKGERKEKEQPKPDYKFYFNLYNPSEKRMVYLIRIKNKMVTIQPENENIYVTLNKKNSKEIVDFLKSF